MLFSDDWRDDGSEGEILILRDTVQRIRFVVFRTSPNNIYLIELSLIQ